MIRVGLTVFGLISAYMIAAPVLHRAAELITIAGLTLPG